MNDMALMSSLAFYRTLFNLPLKSKIQKMVISPSFYNSRKVKYTHLKSNDFWTVYKNIFMLLSMVQKTEEWKYIWRSWNKILKSRYRILLPVINSRSHKGWTIRIGHTISQHRRLSFFHISVFISNIKSIPF